MQAFEILLRQTQDFPLSCIADTPTTDTLATERVGMVVTHFAHTIPVSVPGPRLNIKDRLSRYGDSHVKDKTAGRTSYL